MIIAFLFAKKKQKGFNHPPCQILAFLVPYGPEKGIRKIQLILNKIHWNLLSIIVSSHKLLKTNKYEQTPNK